MPNTPISELLMQKLVNRLDRIQGGVDYFNTLAVAVQRYTHTWDKEEHVVVSLAETPGIILRTLLGGSTGAESGIHQNSMTVEITFYFRGNSAGDTEIHQARHDVEKAVFTDLSGNPDEHFDSNVKTWEWGWETFDLEAQMPIDGLKANLSVVFDTAIGDPAAAA